MQDENGQILQPDFLNESNNSFDISQDSSPSKPKKVGYYKAKLSNFMKTSVFNKNKKNLRYVQNIIEIK